MITEPQLPNGEYLVEIIESNVEYFDEEKKYTRGCRIKLGIYNGDVNVVSILLKLANTSAQNLKESQKILSQIQTAVGVQYLRNTTELHDKKFIMSICGDYIEMSKVEQ